MLRYRAPPLPSLRLRMLSSPSLHSLNPNPRLHPASSISESFDRRFQLFSNPISHPVRISRRDSHGNPQSMTLSRCLSGSTNPVPISSLPESINSDSQILVVVSFYKFADFPDHARLRQPLKSLCEELVPNFHSTCSILAS